MPDHTGAAIDGGPLHGTPPRPMRIYVCAQSVLLHVEPVDPRDLFRGDYDGDAVRTRHLWAEVWLDRHGNPRRDGWSSGELNRRREQLASRVGSPSPTARPNVPGPVRRPSRQAGAVVAAEDHVDDLVLASEAGDDIGDTVAVDVAGHHLEVALEGLPEGINRELPRSGGGVEDDDLAMAVHLDHAHGDRLPRLPHPRLLGVGVPCPAAPASSVDFG